MDREELLKLDRALTPHERRVLFHKPARENAGYPAPPGSGPAGETCRSCKNLHRKQMAGTYLKCLLMEASWTGGGATDVKAGSPACARWESLPAA